MSKTHVAMYSLDNPINLPICKLHNVWTRKICSVRLESNNLFILLPELNLIFQKFCVNVLAFCFGSFSHNDVKRVI